MSRTTGMLRVDKLPARHVSALKKKAEKLGLTPAGYIRQLIEDDLALDRKAQASSLDELAAPFRDAFKGVPEEELDQMVEAARSRRGGPSTRR